MNIRLKTLFDSLETDRQLLREKISHLSPEAFHYAPINKWSLCQILAHLLHAERLSVRYINKKILGVREAGNTGAWEEFKIVLLIISQRLPFKFRAPKVVVLSTPTYASAAELMADWDAGREEMRQLLESIRDSDIRKKIYRHVVVGILNVQHALIFFREHFRHHQPQIKLLMNQQRLDID